MKKTKIVLLKIFYYIFVLPFLWLVRKFHRENPRNKAFLEEFEKANKENATRIEREVMAKIESMPPNYREHFRKLNIAGVQFALAAHAIETLIKRNMRRRNLPDDIGVLFGPGGTIGFGNITELMNSVSWECEIVVPASTTAHEIMRFARINEETARNTILFIACSFKYCGTLIPNFWAIETTATTGILQLVKKEETK